MRDLPAGMDYQPFLMTKLPPRARDSVNGVERDGLFVARPSVTSSKEIPTHDHFSFILPDPSTREWRIMVDGRPVEITAASPPGVLYFPPHVSIRSEHRRGAGTVLLAAPYHVVIAKASRLQAFMQDTYDAGSLPPGPGQRLLSRAVVPLLDRYIEEFGRAGDDRETVLDTLAALILVDLLRSCLDHATVQTRSHARYPGIRKALRAIHRDFDADLPVKELARVAGMSLYRFIVVFRDLVGSTPHAYLTTLRLQAAASHLRAGSFVTEACFKAGFGSLGAFEQAFKRHYGVSPRRYRASS